MVPYPSEYFETVINVLAIWRFCRVIRAGGEGGKGPATAGQGQRQGPPAEEHRQAVPRTRKEKSAGCIEALDASMVFEFGGFCALREQRWHAGSTRKLRRRWRSPSATRAPRRVRPRTVIQHGVADRELVSYRRIYRFTSLPAARQIYLIAKLRFAQLCVRPKLPSTHTH